MKFFEFLLKVMMAAFSGIILVAGVASLVAGIWMRVSPATVLGVLSQSGSGVTPEDLGTLLNLNYLLMAVGALLVVMGALGCYGAIKERRTMLLVHFVMALVLFVAELAGAVAVIGFTDIRDGYGDKSGLLTQFWMVTMDVMGCCGVHGYADFIGSPQHAELNTFPPQCDSHQVHNASSAVIGCLPKFRELIADNQRLVALVILAVVYVEICTVVLSVILYCKLRMNRMVPV